MCSQSRDEIELVRNELQKAGIASETRCNAVAEKLGVNGVELWVSNGRDYMTASQVYARIRGVPPPIPPADATNGTTATTTAPSPASEPANGKNGSTPAEPGKADLKHARSLLEKGLAQMFEREGELAGECAVLRTRADDLSKTLVEAQATIKREADLRAAAEKAHVEQIAAIKRTLEKERNEWRTQMLARAETLKKTQSKLQAESILLENAQRAMLGLKEEIASLESQREEQEKALAQADKETQAEHEARTAAEQSLAKAAENQKEVEADLHRCQDLQKQVQVYVTRLNSICGQMGLDTPAGGQ